MIYYTYSFSPAGSMVQNYIYCHPWRNPSECDTVLEVPPSNFIHIYEFRGGFHKFPPLCPILLNSYTNKQMSRLLCFQHTVVGWMTLAVVFIRTSNRMLPGRMN